MKKYIAEGVGTAMLTLIACGIAVTGLSGYLGIAVGFGAVLMLAIYLIGDISGCHINPAVSFGMFMAGKMKASELWKYIVAQVAGAFAGSLLLALFMKGFDALGANTFDWGDWYIAILVEVILTFIFVAVILKVTEKDDKCNALIIGLTLMLVHLFGFYFTGTSVNPARSLAPGMLQGWDYIQKVWVFLLAPMGGAALAGLFYKHVLKK